MSHTGRFDISPIILEQLKRRSAATAQSDDVFLRPTRIHCAQWLVGQRLRKELSAAQVIEATALDAAALTLLETGLGNRDTLSDEVIEKLAALLADEQHEPALISSFIRIAIGDSTSDGEQIVRSLLGSPIDATTELGGRDDLGGEESIDSLELLRQVPLFADIATDDLTDLATHLREQRFSSGASIVQQNSVGDEMYIIVNGSVRIYTISPNRAEMEVTILGDGTFFGEMALLDGQRRSASAVALKDTLTLVLKRDAFWSVLMGKPAMSQLIIIELTHRVRDLLAAGEILTDKLAPSHVIDTPKVPLQHYDMMQPSVRHWAVIAKSI